MLPPAKSHSQLGGAAALPWVTLEAARLRKPPRRVPARVAQQGPLDNDNPHHGRTGSREAGPCPGGSWSGPTRVRWPRRAGHRPSRGHLGSGPCDTPGAHPGLGCGTCGHKAWRRLSISRMVFRRRMRSQIKLPIRCCIYIQRAGCRKFNRSCCSGS